MLKHWSFLGSNFIKTMYYNKKQIEEFIKAKNDLTKDGIVDLLTPIEQTQLQLTNEEDLVGFFWFEFNENEKPGERIKLCGNTFLRLDFDLYTDDRFALDLYQSQKESKTISEVIKQRQREQEQAKKEDIDKIKLEEQFIKKLKKQ